MEEARKDRYRVAEVEGVTHRLLQQQSQDLSWEEKKPRAMLPSFGEKMGFPWITQPSRDLEFFRLPSSSLDLSKRSASVFTSEASRATPLLSSDSPQPARIAQIFTQCSALNNRSGQVVYCRIEVR